MYPRSQSSPSCSTQREGLLDPSRRPRPRRRWNRCASASTFIAVSSCWWRPHGPRRAVIVSVAPAIASSQRPSTQSADASPSWAQSHDVAVVRSTDRSRGPRSARRRPSAASAIVVWMSADYPQRFGSRSVGLRDTIEEGIEDPDHLREVAVGEPEDVEIAADPDHLDRSRTRRRGRSRALPRHSRARHERERALRRAVVICGDACSEVRDPVSVTDAERAVRSRAHGDVPARTDEGARGRDTDRDRLLDRT